MPQNKSRAGTPLKKGTGSRAESLDCFMTKVEVKTRLQRQHVTKNRKQGKGCGMEKKRKTKKRQLDRTNQK